MHRGATAMNFSNSLDDLDRELALLRQKRELLEDQQNRLHRGGRGRVRGGAGGGSGGGHPISPWDDNAAIRPLFNNSSDYNPQNSGGSGFNYSNLYENSPRDQFRAPSRRNDSRKRVDNSWSDRPNNNVARQPPRKRSRPNPPAEPRFQSGPRASNNAGPDSNRSSFKERSNYKNNRGPSAPYNPPTKTFRNKRAPNGREQPIATAAEGDVLRANIEPHPKVRGRLEHALGVILQNMKTNFPDKEVLFADPLPCKTMKQMLRDRIKGLLIGKQVGSPSEIVVAYRESFPNDDDIIKSVDTLISTTAKKVASNFDVKVKGKDARPSVTPVVAKRSEPVTVAKQNSGPTPVKPSQTQPKAAKPSQKRNPEADIILGHFKENMHWAIDAELRLMFDNLKELYKDQESSEVNIRDSIKKIVALQRARLEEELNKSAEKADDSKVDATQGDASVDEDKANEAVKKETNDGEAPMTAEKNESQAEKVENGEAQTEKNESQVEKTENDNVQLEKGVENCPEQADNSEMAPVKDQEALAKEAELNKTAVEIQKLCNYILGVWLYKHLPVILPKFRETVAKMVRTSLLERVQEETGQKETTIPARAGVVSQNPDQQRYYVSVVGRPKLPKRPKLSAFLWRFNPCSVKRHKSIFNLLFVGFTNKEDYDRILQNSEVAFGNVQVFIKASRARPTNEENDKLINSGDSIDKDGIVIVEDRQGTDGPTEGMIEDTENSKTDTLDFTNDVVTDNLANKETPRKNNDDGAKKNDEKEHFLDNMLDGAIVLDSVGDEDDELLFVGNPDKDSQINVTVDLDETVILDDDDNTTQDEPVQTTDDLQEKAVEEKPVDKDNAAVTSDEKKEDDTKQEMAEEKAAGVTTRRSTRLNN